MPLWTGFLTNIEAIFWAQKYYWIATLQPAKNYSNLPSEFCIFSGAADDEGRLADGTKAWQHKVLKALDILGFE